jgi:PAS domain S-box-containing protein
VEDSAVGVKPIPKGGSELMLNRIMKSLTLKWMIFSVFLATIPLAVAGFNVIKIYQRDLKKSVIGTEELKARMVVERTEAFFERITSNLLTAVNEEEFKISGYSSHIKKRLEDLLSHSDPLWELALLDERGYERIKVSKYKVIGPRDLENKAKSEMFEVASEGTIHYGEFHLTKDIVPTMTIAVPIGKGHGKQGKVLSAKIHLRYLWNLIPQIQMGQEGYIYVVDREGNLIAHPDTRRVLLRTNVRHLPMVSEVLSGREGNLEFQYPGGEKVLCVYKPIGDLGWGVIVQLPVNEAYGPPKQVVRTALMWVLVGLAIAVVLSLTLTRKLTLPIRRLSDEMGEAAKGNLDGYIQPASNDEVGCLTESFNRMVQDLKQSQEVLRETEERYRRIFENSKEMLFITSVDGKFVDINQAAVEMFGYASKDELMGIRVSDTYLNPEERELLRNKMAQEGFVKDFEVKLKKKDGTPMDVLITGSLRRDAAGGILGYEGMIKDISERKRIEENLFQRTEELQTLFDLSKLINQSLELDEVVSLALERVVELTGFEMAGVYLLQRDGETLEFKYHKGYSSAFVENVKVLKLGEGIAGEAVQSKQPILCSIDEYLFPEKLPFLRDEGIQSLVSIPLLAKGEPIGVINLSSRTPRVLTRRDVNLLESIGNQIGLALENAQLFSNVAKAKSEWEATFDAVTDLITIRYKDYRMIRANQAAFERYGLKPAQMIGKKCFEVLHQNDQPCEGCYVTKTLLTKKPATGERDSKYLNGVFRYYTFPIYDEQGEVVAVVDLAREITEEKRLEMEKEAVNRVNKILASSLDVRQVLKGVHSEIKNVFDSERMTLFLLDEAGEGLRYFAPEKDDGAEERARSVIYAKKGTPLEEAIKTAMPVVVPDTVKTGSWIHGELLKEGFRSLLFFPLEHKGKVLGMLNFASKEADFFREDHVRFLRQVATGLGISIENALLLDSIKESEEKYRAVVEGVREGVAMLGTDFKFKYVNTRLLEIFGYGKEELIGMDFRNILTEESRPSVVDRYIQWVTKEADTPHLEFTILRKDGEIRSIEMSNKEMRDSKGNLSFVALMRDITEKKKVEEQLLQAEKLRAVGEMASGVAHDFNNALAAILGNTQLLLYTIQDGETKETLKTIEKVTKDSAQTVRRLQDFARNKVHQELYKVDVNAIVKDSIEITKPKWKDEAQSKGIRIEIVSNLGEVPPATASASELREVFTNMIFNAIEAMPEGGKIAVRTFQRKKNVCVSISDTGIGIREEVKKKIFEPFFTTKPFTNTGLGLSMSYGIVKRFGGEFEVESKLDQGTTFTVLLPIGGDGKKETGLPAAIKEGKKAHILVIDDEDFVRSVLSRTLGQASHRVTLAEDGDKGIRLFKSGKFDMVLTDLGMPGMSGWEVCRVIKAISPHTPVGMITGWGAEMSRSKMEEYGLDFFISKPFDLHQILNAVTQALESKEAGFLS